MENSDKIQPCHRPPGTHWAEDREESEGGSGSPLLSDSSPATPSGNHQEVACLPRPAERRGEAAVPGPNAIVVPRDPRIPVPLTTEESTAAFGWRLQNQPPRPASSPAVPPGDGARTDESASGSDEEPSPSTSGSRGAYEVAARIWEEALLPLTTPSTQDRQRRRPPLGGEWKPGSSWPAPVPNSDQEFTDSAELPRSTPHSSITDGTFTPLPSDGAASPADAGSLASEIASPISLKPAAILDVPAQYAILNVHLNGILDNPEVTTVMDTIERDLRHKAAVAIPDGLNSPQDDLVLLEDLEHAAPSEDDTSYAVASLPESEGRQSTMSLSPEETVTGAASLLTLGRLTQPGLEGPPIRPGSSVWFVTPDGRWTFDSGTLSPAGLNWAASPRTHAEGLSPSGDSEHPGSGLPTSAPAPESGGPGNGDPEPAAAAMVEETPAAPSGREAEGERAAVATKLAELLEMTMASLSLGGTAADPPPPVAESPPAEGDNPFSLAAELVARMLHTMAEPPSLPHSAPPPVNGVPARSSSGGAGPLAAEAGGGVSDGREAEEETTFPAGHPPDTSHHPQRLHVDVPLDRQAASAPGGLTGSRGGAAHSGGHVGSLGLNSSLAAGASAEGEEASGVGQLGARSGVPAHHANALLHAADHPELNSPVQGAAQREGAGAAIDTGQVPPSGSPSVLPGLESNPSGYVATIWTRAESPPESVPPLLWPSGLTVGGASPALKAYTSRVILALRETELAYYSSDGPSSLAIDIPSPALEPNVSGHGGNPKVTCSDPSSDLLNDTAWATPESEVSEAVGTAMVSREMSPTIQPSSNTGQSVMSMRESDTRKDVGTATVSGVLPPSIQPSSHTSGRVMSTPQSDTRKAVGAAAVSREISPMIQPSSHMRGSVMSTAQADTRKGIGTATVSREVTPSMRPSSNASQSTISMRETDARKAVGTATVSREMSSSFQPSTNASQSTMGTAAASREMSPTIQPSNNTSAMSMRETDICKDMGTGTVSGVLPLSIQPSSHARGRATSVREPANTRKDVGTMVDAEGMSDPGNPGALLTDGASTLGSAPATGTPPVSLDPTGFARRAPPASPPRRSASTAGESVSPAISVSDTPSAMEDGTIPRGYEAGGADPLLLRSRHPGPLPPPGSERPQLALTRVTAGQGLTALSLGSPGDPQPSISIVVNKKASPSGESLSLEINLLGLPPGPPTLRRRLEGGGPGPGERPGPASGGLGFSLPRDTEEDLGGEESQAFSLPRGPGGPLGPQLTRPQDVAAPGFRPDSPAPVPSTSALLAPRLPTALLSWQREDPPQSPEWPPNPHPLPAATPPLPTSLHTDLLREPGAVAGPSGLGRALSTIRSGLISGGKLREASLSPSVSGWARPSPQSYGSREEEEEEEEGEKEEDKDGDDEEALDEEARKVLDAAISDSDLMDVSWDDAEYWETFYYVSLVAARELLRRRRRMWARGQK